MSIEALAKLLEDPSFRDSLLRDFDGCFLDPSSIRSCLNGGDDPAVSLVAALPSMAIGASGRRNAANAQRTILHALRSRYPADDPRVQQLEEAWLRNSDQNISGRHRVVSFIMPQHEQGVQITSERMKLAGCFGSMTSLLGVVCGLRSRPAWKAMIGTGVGAAALVFWNDLFIHWDRFFDRDVLPKFDRSFLCFVFLLVLL
uniref:Uncharacterized protein n=1 Tax=Spongospora subterranea TaxID=70186 RepID=A0A0H5QYQ5_9EUKA|eukprot:CRZ06842.1 hypothetical protein [Spongospora subterranea]